MSNCSTNATHPNDRGGLVLIADRGPAALIAVTLDVPASQVGVNIVAMIVDGIDLVERRQQIDTEREAARDAEAKVAALTMELVRRLDADHVPLRDIGEAVGVSFQRVHQLLNA